MLALSRSTLTYNSELWPDEVSDLVHADTTIEAGFTAVLGAEFQVAGRVVLGAEYGLQASWQRRQGEEAFFQSQLLTIKSHETHYRISPRSATLTLGILF